MDAGRWETGPRTGAASMRTSKPLIIDELGYLPFERNAAHLFFQLVSRR
jgi:DNA replication protein DnaC